MAGISAERKVIMSRENAIEMRFEQAMVEKEKAEAEAAKWRKKAISAQNRAKAFQKWLKERDQEITELEINIGGMTASQSNLIKQIKEQGIKLNSLSELTRKKELGVRTMFENKLKTEKGKNKDLYNAIMEIGYIVDKMNLFNLRKKKLEVLGIAGNEYEEGQK